MNRTIGRLRVTAMGLVLPVLLAAAGGLNAQGRGQDCSKLVVNQSYAFTFQGFLNVPAYFEANKLGAPPEGVGAVPTAGGGTMTFLPGGKVGGRLTLAVGLVGIIPDTPFDPDKSVYALSLDATRTPAVCSGSLLTVAPGSVGNFQLLVSPDGQRIEMIHTDVGLTLGMAGFRIDGAGCTNKTIEGDYPYNGRGWTLAGGPFPFPPNQLLGGYFPFAISGGMSFRAAQFPRVSNPGTVDFWDTMSLNGGIYSRTGSGSYTIKPDCTGTMAMTDSMSNGFHLELFVDQKSGDIYAVNVDTAPQTTIPMFLLGMNLSRAVKQ